MTEIEQIKQEIEEIKRHNEIFSRISYVDSCKLLEKVSSLITTIEPQKEEIERMYAVNQHLEIEYADERAAHNSHVTELLTAEKLIQSQKEEIEKLQSQLEWQVEKTSQNLCTAEAFEKEIDSLKAILETEKADKKEINDALIDTLDKVHDMESEINSLKAITELAVKALKQIAYDNYAFADVYNWHQLTKDTLSEIERLRNAQT